MEIKQDPLKSPYDDIIQKDIAVIELESPHILAFFADYGIHLSTQQVPVATQIAELSDDFFEDIGIGRDQLWQNFSAYLKARDTFQDNSLKVNSITIVGGHDKSGKPEKKQITLHAGSITSIVGPTGSGKSRLLADIEWLAQGDTPTGRTVLINAEIPDTDLRFSLEHKLVAQLSQNMNFVMDATVSEFIALHAESRFVRDIPLMVDEIICQANLLAGESFLPHTPLTGLSGGQSRALMIADTALLSTSPVVLIDEIENAGIDRNKALQLLVRAEKIILIATHDPILALMAEQRLVIKNGGIHQLIITSLNEKKHLSALEAIDTKMAILRHKLRSGEIIEDMNF